MADLYESDPRLKYVLVFKNFGAAADASIPTGFELGSGLFVSTVSPEQAAEALRDAQIDDD